MTINSGKTAGHRGRIARFQDGYATIDATEGGEAIFARRIEYTFDEKHDDNNGHPTEENQHPRDNVNDDDSGNDDDGSTCGTPKHDRVVRVDQNGNILEAYDSAGNAAKHWSKKNGSIKPTNQKGAWY